VLTPEYQHCLFPYTFSIVDNDLGTLFVSWQKAMTQPNLTYTPLILATHKNCVTTSNMPSSSSSSSRGYSSKPIVSTNSSKAAAFQLTTTTSAGQQEASNRQHRSMGDAAIAVMEEEEEHIFRSRFPPVDVPDGITVPEFVLAGAEAYADKVALVEAAPGGRSYTYGEVARDVARFARALRSVGIRKGHVVVVVLPNLAVYPVVSLGVMAAGAIFSGVNPRSLAAEIRKQVEDSEARLVVANEVAYDKVKDVGVPVIGIGDQERMAGTIGWDELLAAADRTGPPMVPLEPVQQSDLCALPYSSGTTGVSKGVMLSHRNLVSNLCSSMFAVGPELLGQVVALGLMPFFHIYGITGICCSTLRHKGTVVVMDRFDLRTFLGALVAHRVMFAPVVPPVMLAMVKNPIADEFDLSGLALKSVMTAAAPLAPDLLAAFQKKFPGVQVEEAYGLTEHSCITLTHAGDDPDKGHIAKKNSVGFILPKPGGEVRGPGHGPVAAQEHARGAVRAEPVRDAGLLQEEGGDGAHHRRQGLAAHRRRRIHRRRRRRLHRRQDQGAYQVQGLSGTTNHWIAVHRYSVLAMSYAADLECVAFRLLLQSWRPYSSPILRSKMQPSSGK
jgi:4-coumarate--CoA ligase